MFLSIKSGDELLVSNLNLTYENIPFGFMQNETINNFLSVVRDMQSKYFAKDPMKVYLNVSFSDKDEAHSLGARWDRDNQSWYCNPNDLPKMKKWTVAQNRSSYQDRMLCHCMSMDQIRAIAIDR